MGGLFLHNSHHWGPSCLFFIPCQGIAQFLLLHCRIARSRTQHELVPVWQQMHTVSCMQTQCKSILQQFSASTVLSGTPNVSQAGLDSRLGANFDGFGDSCNVTTVLATVVADSQPKGPLAVVAMGWA